MATKVFVNDLITLTLETSKNLTGYTCFVKFKRPDGSGSHWTAIQHPLYNTKMRAVATFEVSGNWQVQAFIVDGISRHHGAWADIKVYDPIAPDSTAPPTTMVPTT